MLVANIKNLLESERIDVLVKNEFAAGGVGELSAFDAWPEIWLVNEKDMIKAQEIINQCQSKANRPEWYCQNCKEPNDAAFEICWQCQQAPE